MHWSGGGTRSHHKLSYNTSSSLKDTHSHDVQIMPCASDYHMMIQESAFNFGIWRYDHA